jgi:septum formation protein
VRRLATEKAEEVAERRPDALVVGSDTVVVIEGEVLGKPRDEVHALEMLMRLQGREHVVQTGIAVAAPASVPVRGEGEWPGVVADVETVRVRFREFDEGTAREYVETGEPMDKAGAYGIQGFGATIVERIEGDYFAVMGLPIGRMVRLFGEVGWRYNFRGLEPL